MLPSLLTQYTHIRPDDRFIVMKRTPKAVCQSKDRLPEFSKDCELLDQTPTEIERNFQHSLQILEDQDIDYQVVKFPEIIRDPSPLINQLDRATVAEWKKVAQVDKVHIRSSQTPAGENKTNTRSVSND